MFWGVDRSVLASLFVPLSLLTFVLRADDEYISVSIFKPFLTAQSGCGPPPAYTSFLNCILPCVLHIVECRCGDVLLILTSVFFVSSLSVERVLLYFLGAIRSNCLTWFNLSVSKEKYRLSYDFCISCMHGKITYMYVMCTDCSRSAME